jgi:hypothetical protein
MHNRQSHKSPRDVLNYYSIVLSKISNDAGSPFKGSTAFQSLLDAIAKTTDMTSTTGSMALIGWLRACRQTLP